MSESSTALTTFSKKSDKILAFRRSIGYYINMETNTETLTIGLDLALDTDDLSQAASFAIGLADHSGCTLVSYTATGPAAWPYAVYAGTHAELTALVAEYDPDDTEPYTTYLI